MERDSVRRCQRCNEPAVIIVNRWETRLLGVLPLHNSAQTDHQCQSCGARFTLRHPLLLFFLVGALSGGSLVGMGMLSMVGAVIALFVQGPAEAAVLVVVGSMSIAFGAACLYYAAGSQVIAWLNPLVPGATMPEQQQGPLQAARACSCGAPAQPVSQRLFTSMRLPIGATFTYLCGVCNREFTVPNRLAVVVRFAMAWFLGASFLLLASLLPFEELRGDHFFVLGVLALGSGLGGLLGALGIVKRVRHPLTR